VAGHQAAQGLGVQQRHVTIGDQDRAGGGRDLVEAALDGASGAGDLVLVGDGDLGRVIGQVLGDPLALVPQHHHQLGGAGPLGGGRRLDQQLPSSDGVEDLGGAGLHACPGGGGQYDDGGR